jgi:hypothetical protein
MAYRRDFRTRPMNLPALAPDRAQRGFQNTQRFVQHLWFNRNRHQHTDGIGIHAAAEQNQAQFGGLCGQCLGGIGIRRVFAAVLDTD